MTKVKKVSVVITKKKILTALAMEPLVAGTFVYEKNDPTCGVCAVGGALRATGLKNAAIDKYIDSVNDDYDFSMSSDLMIEEALSAGRILEALSSHFEKAAARLRGFMGVDMYGANQVPGFYNALHPGLISWAKDSIPDNYRKVIRVKASAVKKTRKRA